MQDFMVGVAFFLVIEGLIYALFPETMKRMAAEVPKMPASGIRIAGVVSLAIGVFGVWLIRG